LKENIKKYFGSDYYKGIKIDYVEESMPLGTLGSVCLKDNFFHKYGTQDDLLELHGVSFNQIIKNRIFK
jgi:NDP-sugar pyrophosphorylase family protein